MPCPPVLNFGANAGLFAKKNLNKLISTSNSTNGSKIESHKNKSTIVVPSPLPPPPPPLSVAQFSSQKKTEKVYMCKAL